MIKKVLVVVFAATVAVMWMGVFMSVVDFLIGQ